MITVKIEEIEYILRCDLNVIEYLYEKYGDTEKFFEAGISAVKDIAAQMINEHFLYIGSEDRVTPEFISMRINGAEYVSLRNSVIEAINASMTIKN